MNALRSSCRSCAHRRARANLLRAAAVGAAVFGLASAHAADTAAPPVISTPSHSAWFNNGRSDALTQIGVLPNKLALTIAEQAGTTAPFAAAYGSSVTDKKAGFGLADFTAFTDGGSARFSLFPRTARRPFSWFSPSPLAIMPRFDPVETVPTAPPVTDWPTISPAVTVKPTPAPARYAPAVGGAPDLFGSEALRIGKTTLDAKWRAVADVRLGKGPWSKLVASASGDAMQELATVNRWVNHQVSFADDAHGDRWANAAQTLAQHRGDCEDYAIAKMQILRAMGFAENDLYLVIARDLVRRADHALLAVRVDDRFVVLDSGTDALLDGTVPQDYRPIFTFSGNRTWIHGYKAPPAVIALAAVQPIGRAN
jgi:predicted transglutaminase-like cysteine proteinase